MLTISPQKNWKFGQKTKILTHWHEKPQIWQLFLKKKLENLDLNNQKPKIRNIFTLKTTILTHFDLKNQNVGNFSRKKLEY